MIRLLCALLLIPAALSAGEGELRFVQVTDTHLGELNHAARLERIVKLVNALPYDIAFVAVTGDVTTEKTMDDSEMAKAKEAFSKFRFPVLMLPGNHDILQKGGTVGEWASRWKSHFGPLSFVTEKSGVSAVCFFSEPLREGYSVPGYDPLVWLSNALAGAKGRDLLVFQHSPAHGDFYNGLEHHGWPEPAREAWEKLLNADGRVKGVFCGHFHRDELNWAGTIPVFVSSSVAGFWKRQASYRIYTLSNGRISYTTQYLE